MPCGRASGKGLDCTCTPTARRRYMTRLSGHALRRARRNIQMVLQDPYTSLNPRMTVGDLIGEVTRDMSTLMRQELELAKAELKAEATKAGDEVKAQATKAGKGAGMLGGAGFAGYMMALFLSIALWWALSHLVGHSWSALIVAVLWGIVAAVLYSMGRKQLKQVDFSGLKQVNPKPERTVETLQQVPGALKPN